MPTIQHDGWTFEFDRTELRLLKDSQVEATLPLAPLLNSRPTSLGKWREVGAEHYQATVKGLGTAHIALRECQVAFWIETKKKQFDCLTYFPETTWQGDRWQSYVSDEWDRLWEKERDQEIGVSTAYMHMISVFGADPGGKDILVIDSHLQIIPGAGDGHVLTSDGAGNATWQTPGAGAQGPAGNDGATGAQGPQGKQGETGAAGATGAAAPCTPCADVASAAVAMACIVLDANSATSIQELRDTASTVVDTMLISANVCEATCDVAAEINTAIDAKLNE